MQTLRAWALTFASIGALTTIVGCAPSTVTVHGTLHKDGKPYQLVPDEQVQITFAGEGTNGVPFSAGARVKDDSTFILSGPSNQGIPAGTYRIAIGAQIYGPKNEGDRFNGDFEQAATSLTYTVTADPLQEIVVDVAKKTVTKK